MPALFSAMEKNQFSVAFVKKLHGITIRHSLYVYAGDLQQQQLMKRYLLGGDEMFAQRGHSYWRSEQITDPLTALKRDKQISDHTLTSKQRFLSLGSCGGVKAYTRLTKMFDGHVDILATIGTGMAIINDPYNWNFFEIVAKNPSSITWKDVAEKSSFIFAGGRETTTCNPDVSPRSCTKYLMKKNEKKLKQELPVTWIIMLTGKQIFQCLSMIEIR